MLRFICVVFIILIIVFGVTLPSGTNYKLRLNETKGFHIVTSHTGE